MLGLSKFINFIQSHKIVHTVVEWALKGKLTSLSSLSLSYLPSIAAWKIVDNIQPILPYAASMDDMVAIAGQLETTANGKLSWILDRLPRLSRNVAMVFFI
jgi:hypothetical protein